MAGDESVFARWSRRKRNFAARRHLERDSPPGAAEIARPVSRATLGEDTPTSLPPIESIESVSDVKAFLAPGVPLELTRAALRRAWTVTPAIRNFIGLSENAWDFTAHGGVPGFGLIDREDVRQLMAKLSGEAMTAAPNKAEAEKADYSATLADAAPVAPVARPLPSIAAAQHEDGQRKARALRQRRRHGGALPK